VCQIKFIHKGQLISLKQKRLLSSFLLKICKQFNKGAKQMLLTIEETSNLLKIKKNTIYAWVHNKKIPYIKMGGKLVFSSEKLNEFIKINSYNVA